jgi:tRNA-specific 2-thiouridylase
MERQGTTMLRKAVDEPKDQTYFLHRLPPALLQKVIFPLGGITKIEARELARRYGLTMAEKPESQDFVSGGYSALFDSEEPGDIVDETGKILGRHDGIVHYTIGQRRGLGIGGGTPLYVAGLDAIRNRVIVSDDASLFATGLEGSDALLHDPTMAGKPFQAQVRIRQNHRPAAATITVNDNQAIVTFVQPQRAVAPGQSAVFYDDDGFVLGGCIIDRGTGLPGKPD